jgi:hypothetical protein
MAQTIPKAKSCDEEMTSQRASLAAALFATLQHRTFRGELS